MWKRMPFFIFDRLLKLYPKKIKARLPPFQSDPKCSRVKYYQTAKHLNYRQVST